MVIIEQTKHLDNFEKERMLLENKDITDIILRAGTEGQPKDERYIVKIEDQTLIDTDKNTKKSVTQKKLMGGSISQILDVLVEQVYHAHKFEEARMSGETYTGSKMINANINQKDNMLNLNTLYEKISGMRSGGKIKMLVEGKHSQIKLDEPVKENMCLLRFMEGSKERGRAYILDLSFGKDSSGGQKPY